MSDKRFRVAFSYAGEKRDFVSNVAAILAKRFGEKAILYDRYHLAEFSRGDLAFYLPDLYEKEADLIVVVLCPDYEKKEWPGLEWNTAFGILKKRNADDVMLTRFGGVEGRGLRGLAGYIDLDEMAPEAAAERILERLALNQRRRDSSSADSRLAPSGAHSTAVRNNLPRLQSFFGREKELDAIRDALDPESRTWGVLIDGPGGMGKTSLAVRAAYDCTPDQFERIIFVSVKDRELDDDGVRTLGTFILPGFIEMLNELARELDRTDIPKVSEDQRIRLLLDALRETKTLLILDNLESLPKLDRDQLFTLVKRLPQGCKAILTSRRRIGSGSELLILEQLDEAAALDTLAELALHNKLLAKTNDAERVTLYRQTGGNPLLLRWVAGQLGRGSCRTFTDALQFLRSCPPDNDPLEFVFGDLAQEFTAEETSALAALTYFTLPAKVEHIAEVAALTPILVETALRGLTNRSLVVPDQEEKSFALVPMVAEFLRRSRPEIITATGDRLEQRAYALMTENGYRHFERFSVLDAQWPTLAAALERWADEADERLQIVCDALDQFLEFTGRWDEALALLRQAEQQANRAGEHDNVAWCAYRAGIIHHRRGEAEEVLACADRAAAVWQADGRDDRDRAIALNLTGLGYELKKDYPAALTAFKKSLDFIKASSPDKNDLATALNWLGQAERRCGDLESAERNIRHALELARSEASTAEVAMYTGNLADLALDRQDWAAAESLAREALALSETVGRQELVAADCRRLAQALLRLGRAREALPYARQSVAINVSLRSNGLAYSQRVLRECESESDKPASES